MKETIKKNKELIVAVFVVLLLIITGSYAWLTLTKTSDKVNVIKAGSLSMELDDTATEGIELINTIPMSYQQGMETEEYTFILKNNSSVASEYSVSLDDAKDESGNPLVSTTEKLGDNYIRFILLKNGETAYPKNSKLLSQDPGRIIDTGVIAANSQIEYSLRIWIDSKSENSHSADEEEQVMGKKFVGKIGVSAEQYNG